MARQEKQRLRAALAEVSYSFEIERFGEQSRHTAIGSTHLVGVERHRFRQGNNDTVARRGIGVAVGGPHRARKAKRFEPSSSVGWSGWLYVGVLRRFYIERDQR